MSDFKVVLEDLTELSANFTKESSAYEQLIPSINPPAVDGGDDNLNKVLTGLVKTFDNLHHRMVASISDHADKLKYAHDSFERKDIEVHDLFEDLVPKELR